MNIWALADLHLAFGVPSKSMEVFGASWEGYAAKIEKNWRASISPDDLVLIPGDISWAMHFEEAMPDLLWIDALPGTKLLLKGNHDYWWSSSSKLKQGLPPSIHFIHNNAFHWKDATIGGTRLWDTEEYGFGPFIDYRENKVSKSGGFSPEDLEAQRKIFRRELERLKLSLSQLDKNAKWRIALTHYPPIGADLQPSLASKILEEFQIQICIFGHLHNIKKNTLHFKEARGVRYLLVSADYLDFMPLKVL